MFREVSRSKVLDTDPTIASSLKKNLYGQKQAGRVWNEFLREGLLARVFVQSRVAMCLYFRGEVAWMIYTDDGILVGQLSRSCSSQQEASKNIEHSKLLMRVICAITWA